MTVGTGDSVTITDTGRVTEPNATGDYYIAPLRRDVCPGCGRCKHCGRGGDHFAPRWPGLPMYPYYAPWQLPQTWC